LRIARQDWQLDDENEYIYLTREYALESIEHNKVNVKGAVVQEKNDKQEGVGREINETFGA
jgi:hypothetical protein